MERKLPIIEIHGTPYFVNVQRESLIQIGDSENEIFFQGMRDLGSHYEMDYNLDMNTVASPFDLQTDRILRAKVEQMNRLDTHGMALKYGKRINDIIGKNDYEIIVDQELLQQRKAGKLPLLAISDHRYYIDVHQQRLIDAHNRDHTIYISSLEIQEEKLGFYGYYNYNEKQFVEIDPKTKDFPSGIIYVEIPYSLAQLDAVGMAKETNHDLKSFLRANPPKEMFTANIIKIEDSPIASLINENYRMTFMRRFTLFGTSFILDIQNQRLVEENNPKNILSFIQMKDMGTHYTFNYDPHTKTISNNFFFHSDSRIPLRIPQMKDLHPRMMAKLYVKDLAELDGKSDFEIIVDQDLLERRKTELPVVTIEGTDFEVDILRKAFINVKDPDININEEAMYFDPDFERISGLYNTRLKQFVPIDNKLINWPKDTMYITLPSFDALDPVKLAREFPEELAIYLRIYPLQEKYHALVVPRSETPVQELINQNIRRLNEARELAEYTKAKKNKKAIKR